MEDRVSIEIYKQARKEGKTKTECLKKAGYSDSTARTQQARSLSARVGDAEILAEARNRVTVDLVLAKLLAEADNAQKSSDRIAAIVALGKYLQMFKDEQKQGIAIFNNVNDLQQDIDKLRSKRTASEAVVEPKTGQQSING